MGTGFGKVCHEGIVINNILSVFTSIHKSDATHIHVSEVLNILWIAPKTFVEKPCVQYNMVLYTRKRLKRYVYIQIYVTLVTILIEI